MTDRPSLTRVLETVLYYTDHERTRRFYGEVLGMRLLDEDPGRYLFYRAGESVFLLFERDDARNKQTPPPHGADGPVHTCFQVPPEDYPRWKSHLREHGEQLLDEIRWRKGLSFYFRDPAGNVLEIANADIWDR